MKKIYSLAIGLIALSTLSGCLSKIPQEITLAPYEFTEENSKIVGEGEGFSIQVPSVDDLFLIDEQQGAKLYQVAISQTVTSGMSIESYPIPLDVSLKDVLGQEGVTEVKKEDLEINGLRAMRLVLELPITPGIAQPLYLIEGNGNTFIFRMIDGNVYEAFDAAIATFTLTQ